MKSEKVKSRKVSCNGQAHDHPKIYLSIKDKEVDCPYCGKKFILSKKDAI